MSSAVPPDSTTISAPDVTMMPLLVWPADTKMVCPLFSTV